jgi:hypothetical protein
MQQISFDEKSQKKFQVNVDGMIIEKIGNQKR